MLRLILAAALAAVAMPASAATFIKYEGLGTGSNGGADPSYFSFTALVPAEQCSSPNFRCVLLGNSLRIFDETYAPFGTTDVTLSYDGALTALPVTADGFVSGFFTLQGPRNRFSGAVQQLSVSVVEWDGAPSISYSTWAMAVPEPATWAMMIAGFAAIGLGMRRKHYASCATELYPRISGLLVSA